jgi:hypothetical protein
MRLPSARQLVEARFAQDLAQQGDGAFAVEARGKGDAHA